VIIRTRTVTLRAHFLTPSMHFEQRVWRRYFYGRSCHARARAHTHTRTHARNRCEV